MYINQIDNLFDEILNKFNNLLDKKKTFEKYSDDQNFVKYMNDIIEIIKLFIKELNIKEIEELIGTSKHTNHIIEIIKSKNIEITDDEYNKIYPLIHDFLINFKKLC